MPNDENIAIFEDTVDLCQKTPQLFDAIRESVRNQTCILQSEPVADAGSAHRFEAPAKLVLSKKRTMEAARAYADGSNKVAVLNFASATNPGGGVVNGSRAQEESLCRVSTLYFTLNTDENWRRFYTPHRKSHNPLHNDDILYTPAVVVVKSDTAHPARLAEKDWYSVDVITCAAPNLRTYPSNRYNSGDGNARLLLSDSELRALHEQRDRRIFDVAALNGVEVLVLGAFGCGAFCNNPAVVADVLVQLARRYEYAFKTVEFAVFCPPHDDGNYRAFEAALRRR